MQVGGERDVRLMLSPTLFALVVATVTAALAAKGARAGRTELCCGRGSSSLGGCAPHVLSLTECWLEQPGEQPMLAKRCAQALGSDRRPRRM